MLVSTMLAPEVNLMLEDGTAWVRDYVPGTEPPAGAVDFRVPVDPRLTSMTRAIRLEVDVPGTPEEVWATVATGAGITSWFVPVRRSRSARAARSRCTSARAWTRPGP